MALCKIVWRWHKNFRSEDSFMVSLIEHFFFTIEAVKSLIWSFENDSKVTTTYESLLTKIRFEQNTVNSEFKQKIQTLYS